MVFNLPNMLSLFRILLVPVFCLLFFSDLEYAKYYAVGVYALASLTDLLDGIIARRTNNITKLGRILDPLGDKLMCFAVVLCIAIDGIVPMWAMVVLFAKESLMAVGGLLMYEKATDVVSSNVFGKAATAVFFVVCVLLMLFEGIPGYIAKIMISFALALTVTALITYLVQFVGIMRAEKKQRD